MIESVFNAIQLGSTGAASAASLFFAIRGRERAWLLLGLFSGTYFLGDLYWHLYLIFYGDTPHFSFIPDLSWYASLLFLYLLVVHVGGGRRIHSPALIPVPVFTVGACVFFMQWGAYVSNIIYAMLMTLILWRALGSLITIRAAEKKELRAIGVYAAALFFCAMEYCMWISSCFWENGDLSNPYFWFDLLMSLGFIAFLPLTKKAVSE